MFQRQLTFGEAVRRALTVNYCNFNGRASLSEFWWFTLFGVILSFVLGFVFNILAFVIPVQVLLIIQYLIGLALLLPNIGVSVRRLHDVGKSGWWYLLIFTVIGIIPLIIW